MSLNTEQSTQLREAVKSKLVEIGEYVDDQLTDYVMIMVTNKKSEKQMAEDLELFLGGLDQSTKFSIWLHSQLKLVASSSKTTTNAEAEELAIQIDSNEFNEEQQQQQQVTTSTTSTTTQASARPISSCVGAVIKHNDRRSSDDHTKSSSRHRLSSSIVKVSPSSDEKRRKNSSSLLQSGKSMLFKAVDAANKSITEPTKRVKTDSKKSFHDDVGEDSVVRRQVRSSADTATTSTTGDDRRSGEENETNEKTTGDRRSIEHRLSFETKALKTLDTNQRRVESVSNRHHETITTTSAAADTTNTTGGGGGGNTKFFVTFAGLDDHQFANKLTKKRSFNEMNELDELDYDETYDDHHHDDYPLEEGGQDMEMGDDDQMNEEEMSGNGGGVHQLPRYMKKKPIRCSYWPACDKGDSCMFIHPNKPCATFPNCPFGQQCHYIHPNCRFDGFCTRPECPFTHTVKKQKPSLLSQQQTVPSASGSQTNVVIDMAAVKQSQLQQGVVTMVEPQAPKITINKIQPPPSFQQQGVYSLNKKVSNTTSSVANPSPAAAANQYKLVHGGNIGGSLATASSVTTTKPFVNTLPNCKFGIMCKNPKCAFVHPPINVASSLTPTSQFKWVATNNKTTSQVVAQQNQQQPSQQQILSSESLSRGGGDGISSASGVDGGGHQSQFQIQRQEISMMSSN